ncbi:MAG TPA: 1,4-alpha-glucan branching protein [Mycobacteriales bacterium]|jgi:hypothetical protein|nr:1,4-alpha-glucan branching protein [Mycobacteriales bacterium]
MAEIHNTTMSPTKLELLDRWLPEQPWYAGTGRPDLNRAGGFRLDDPDGEVGIEFMFVRDDANGDGTTYQVPMTYRGEALAGAPEAALIGTSEHGVLGTRWIYDGAHDPALLAQLVALLEGAAEPQHQSKSDTADPTVHVEQVASGSVDSESLRILRVLVPDPHAGRTGCVTATWRTADDREERGPVVLLD